MKARSGQKSSPQRKANGSKPAVLSPAANRTALRTADPIAGPCPCDGGCPRCLGAEASAPLAPLAPLHPGGSGGVNLSGPGEPLAAHERQYFEPLLGVDLKEVRLHRNGEGQQAAAAVHATAFTQGSDIAFAPNEYTPGSAAGHRLLGHELSHVVQQGQARGNRSPSFAAEVEAEQASAALAAGRPFNIRALPDSPMQRQPAATEEHIDLKNGLTLDQDISAGQAILSYQGQPWVVYRWTPAPNHRLNNFSFKSIPSPTGHGGIGTIAITADFTIEASIDRSVEQTLCDYSQGPVRLIHNYSFPGTISYNLPDNKTVTKTAPNTVTNDYQPQPLPEMEGELPMPKFEVRPPEPETPPVNQHRVWSFDTIEQFDQFAATHPKDAWACIMTADGRFIAFSMTREHLRRLSDNIRHDDFSTKVLDDYPGSRLAGVYLDGKRLDSLQILANRYYRSEGEAADGLAGDPQECEVYNMGRGDYGRKPLTHSQAVARWVELDKLSYDEVLKEKTALDPKPDKPFASLRVRGLRLLNDLDWQYFQAKNEFFKHADQWNTANLVYELDPQGNPKEGGQTPLNFYLTHVQRMGDLMRQYLMIETDRPVGDPRFHKTLEDRPHLAMAVADEMVMMVENTAQRILFDPLKEAHDQLQGMVKDQEKLRMFVLVFAMRKGDDQKRLLEFMGVPKDKRTALQTTMGTLSKAVQLAQGITVDGFSLEQMKGWANHSASELADTLEKLRTRKITALYLDGDLGNAIRDQAYKQLGFKVLKGNTFPHTQEASGLLPGAMSGKTEDFTNLAEQLYANRMAHAKRAGTIMAVATLGASVALGVAMIFVAGEIAAGVAAWIWGTTEGIGYTLTQLALTGVIYEGLNVGKEYLTTGQSGLDPNAPGGQAGDFFLKAGITAGTFGVFKGLNFIFSAVSRSLVTAAVGGEEAYVASRGAQGIARAMSVTMETGFFIAFSVEEFYRANGHMPEGDELFLLIYENLLFIAMMEVGARLSRPYTEKVGIWARGRKLTKLQSRYTDLTTETRQVQISLSELIGDTKAANTEAPVLMAKQRELMAKQKTLLSDIKAAYKGQPEYAQVAKEVNAELGRIADMGNMLKEAEFLKATKIMASAEAGSTYFYKPGTEGKIKEFYGESHTSKPDKDGVIHVSSGTRLLTFKPMPAGGQAPVAGVKPEVSEAIKARREKLAQRKENLVERADRLGFADTTIDDIRKLKPRDSTRQGTLKKTKWALDAAEKQIKQAERYGTTKLDELAKKAYERVSQRLTKKFGPDAMTKLREGKLSSMTDAEVGEALRVTFGEQGLDIAELRGLLHASRPGPNGELMNTGMIFNRARSAGERNFVLRTFGEMMDKNIPGSYDVMRSMTTSRNNWRGGMWQMEYAKAGVGLDNIKAFEVTQSLVIEGEEKVRRYDIELKDGTRLELKDWNNWFPGSLKSQFGRDVLLRTDNFSNPGGLRTIRWVFRAPGPVPKAEIQAAMNEALQKVLENAPVNAKVDIMKAFASADLIEISSASGLRGTAP